VAAANKAFPDRVYKGTTDKKGNFLVTGLLYAAQAQEWTISVKADGKVPVSVKTVARDAQQNLYLQDEAHLSATKVGTDVKLRGFSQVRMEFVMRAGDLAAEAAPPPAVPLPGGAGAGAVAGAAADSDAYAQAIEKVRAGDSEGSVDLFKSAIEAKPDDWERRDLYAKVLSKLDRQGEATIQANKAVASAPDKAAPLITLTDIYLARGLPDKAAESIARAEKLEPENMKVVERAAAVAASAGNIDEAITLSEKVLAAKPDNTEVLVSLAALYNRNKQPKKAEEALNKVVALDPANAHRTFYNLGVVIENRDDVSEGDHRKAIEAFRKAIDLKPDYSIAHRDLGFALLRTGDLMGARKELQKYVDLDPRAKDAADVKATVKSLDSAK
jgi:tetratricopeptide (TPR) repeat protein